MSNTIIKLENISKQYRLGQVGTQTLRGDLQRWWHTLRGKEDPTLKIGQTNQLNNQSSINNNQSDYVWALKDIDLEVKQGEILGIIGKNGAGKSTLLKLLSRVTTPTTGSIKVKGRIASLLEVGTGFHPDLTGRENIFLNGAILGMTKAEIKSKFDEIVDFAGVAKYIDTPVKRYSSGMYVRLAFAVAAHLEPDILVVDEVLAVGDAEFQKKAIGKMQDISSGGGRTVLFVSHNMLAIKSLCTSGILIVNGCIKNNGSIENVVDSYLAISSKVLASYIDIEKESKGFIIHSIAISNNGIIGNFNIEEDLTIDIIVSSDRDYKLININVFFNTIEGSLIFASCSPAGKFEKGNYKYQCIIPANTLNDIFYSIDIMVVENGEKAILEAKEIIQIEGVEKKRDGSWLGRFPGLLRPSFEWSKNINHE